MLSVPMNPRMIYELVYITYYDNSNVDWMIGFVDVVMASTYEEMMC
jgi:hypothetical protein